MLFRIYLILVLGILAQSYGTAQFGNKFAIEFEKDKPLQIQYDDELGRLYLLSPEQETTYLKLYPADAKNYPPTRRKIGIVDPQSDAILHSYSLEPMENYLLANMSLHKDLPADAINRPLHIVELYDNNGTIQRNVLARVQINQ